MTGFARSDGRHGGPPAFAWVWEAKSVNGKGLEVRLRLPPGFDLLEVPARQAVAEAFSRGSITLALSIVSDAGAAALKLNEPLLDALIALAARKGADLPAGVAPARLDALLSAKGVLDGGDLSALSPEAAAKRDAALLAGLKTCLAALAAARRQEGARLMPTLTAHLDAIAALCTEAGAMAALQPEALRTRLIQQLQELTAELPALPPERLAQEAALLVVKADIREELDRLAAHVAQARELVAAGAPCGRRLDFLAQEFNREANTLCSKSADLGLTRVGLGLKAGIDQFREQIQNIE